MIASNTQPMALNGNIAAKKGFLQMDFEVDSDGCSILRHLYRRAPIVVQQALYFDEQMPTLPCVYILSSGGPYVDGDRYEHHISLAKGAMAHISTGASTKVATMEHDQCRLTQTFRLAEGSYLEWLPEPTIPHSGARLTAHTEIEIAPTAALFYAESYTCGRLHHGERFVYDWIDSSLVVSNPRHECLLREAMKVVPLWLSPERLGVLGGYRHYGSVLMFAPAEVSRRLYAELTPILTPTLAQSVALLRNDAGVAVRVLTHTTDTLRSHTHSLCSTFRLLVKGKPLPERFPWR